MDRLLTYSEAAAMAERSASRIAQLVKSGAIKVERFTGGVRIRESSLKAYIRDRDIPASLPNSGHESGVSR